MKTDKPSAQALKRIAEVHSALRVRGFKRLSEGLHGLPAYDTIEVWCKDATHLYLVWGHQHGDYDILSPLTTNNRIAETWAAIDRIGQAPDCPHCGPHCDLR